ncbi:MAG: glutamate mutase L, partial [Paraclostridium sp.]
MKVDVLVAEIGSTTTVVNAFDDIDSDKPKFVGQGQAPTTVFEGGDVRNGLEGAIKDLSKKLGVDNIEYTDMLATSSAAGGLKMTVHGLVYDMTAKAAKEAALGAGAIIHKVTAGKLRRTDLKDIENIKPNIILIAGGVDYGERDTAIYNAEMIANLNLNIPVIYAGNIENQEEMKLIFEDTNYQLYLVDNVYPKIDVLNVEPTRNVIQDAFEKHITHAPGMKYVKEMVNGHIVPTPGAVMEATKMLNKYIGDLIVLDVGGATTDLHSVTEGNEAISRIMINPEPLAKRTVEGDLGVYVNMKNIVELIGKENLEKELGLNIDEMMSNHIPIPKTENQIIFVERLTKEAVLRATS